MDPTVPVSVEDLYPKVPKFEDGPDRWPQVGESQVTFMAYSRVLGQVFTRSFHARELIRQDVSTRLPELRAHGFFFEARELLAHVREAKQAHATQQSREEVTRKRRMSGPILGQEKRRSRSLGGLSVFDSPSENAPPEWDDDVDEEVSEADESSDCDQPISGACPGFWPMLPRYRTLVARDVLQVFEEARDRGSPHVVFRIYFAARQGSLRRAPGAPEPKPSQSPLRRLSVALETKPRHGSVHRSASAPWMRSTNVSPETSGRRRMVQNPDVPFRLALGLPERLDQEQPQMKSEEAAVVRPPIVRSSKSASPLRRALAARKLQRGSSKRR